MTDHLLYLTRTDVQRLTPARTDLRAAIADAVLNTRSGRLKFLAKATLPFDVGHSFQSMPALQGDATGNGFATLKWVSVVPVGAQAGGDNVHSLICVNDLQSGEPLAIMDGNHVTLVRTAAISALAAEMLVSESPSSIGFIGCGQQALEHLHAFVDLFPGLQDVYCYSRSIRSAEALARSAEATGRNGIVCQQADPLLEACDIVISSVPAAPGLTPFLDARRMKSTSLALMVDLGRSWIEAGFQAFDHLATDSLQQSRHPYANDGAELKSVQATEDLETLLTTRRPRSGRKAFFFKGIASCDLAVATMIYRAAREQGEGVRLMR